MIPQDLLIWPILFPRNYSCSQDAWMQSYVYNENICLFIQADDATIVVESTWEGKKYILSLQKAEKQRFNYQSKPTRTSGKKWRRKYVSERVNARETWFESFLHEGFCKQWRGLRQKKLVKILHPPYQSIQYSKPQHPETHANGDAHFKWIFSA